MTALTLELFTLLDAIDRRGSFAAAAEELNKVPSALSYTIQKYEEQLGMSLFVREGRRSVFTSAGRLLLEQGRDLLGAVVNLEDDVRTLVSGWEPRIRIAVDALVPIAGVLEVIAGFLHRHPQVEIDLSEEVLGGAWEVLIQDRVQLVIGAPAPRPKVGGIQVQPLGTVTRVCAVSADHPLASIRGTVSLETLACHRLVVVHDSSRSAIPRDARLLNTKNRFYVQTIAQKIAAQRAGIGVGFVPLSAVQADIEAGTMVAVSVEGMSLGDELHLAWKTTSKGKGLLELITLLQQAHILA